MPKKTYIFCQFIILLLRDTCRYCIINTILCVLKERKTEMDYDEYLTRCDLIRKTNDELLKLFAHDLMECGLTNRTIDRHLSNVNLYINRYLLREDANTMEAGINNLDDFLGNFFIRKCMWSTPANIKTTATSIKKFYKCMLDYGKIEKADYDFLCAQIRNDMGKWQDTCNLYNDPDEPNPFFSF